MKIPKIQYVMLFLVLACACYAGSEPPVTPDELVRRLYTVHQPQNEKELQLNDSNTLSNYFIPELTHLLVMEDQCREKTSEICNLEFDPIFYALDFAQKTLNLDIEKDPASPHRYKVTFTNISRKSLVYEFIETRSGWRISDIIYPQGFSLKKLLSQKSPESCTTFRCCRQTADPQGVEQQASSRNRTYPRTTAEHLPHSSLPKPSHRVN